MNTRKVLSNGRITIPAELRKKYGIKPGTKILFNEDEDAIIIFPATAEAFRKGLGFGKIGKGMLKSLMEEKKRESDL